MLRYLRYMLAVLAGISGLSFSIAALTILWYGNPPVSIGVFAVVLFLTTLIVGAIFSDDEDM